MKFELGIYKPEKSKRRAVSSCSPLLKLEFMEALEIIKGLVEHINWLGGDAYEVGASEKACSKSHAFIERHEPKDKQEPQCIRLCQGDGLYVRRDGALDYYVGNCTKKNSKRRAKNVLSTGLGNVKCIVTALQIAEGVVAEFKWAGIPVLLKDGEL